MREIVLTKGFRALVDDEDYESLARHRWMVNASRVESRRLAHAARKDGGRTIMMHREIMAAPPGVHVDHLRHHDLGEKIIDNRRSNLRLATRSQNLGNSRKLTPASSPFKGVSWHRAKGEWRASISCCGKRSFLGAFMVEALAAYAYDLAAVRLFGEFALTNFPVPGASRSLFCSEA